MSQCKLEEVPVVLNAQHEQSPSRLPSYRPYPWPFANRILDAVDQLTDGRAGVCQRFATYVIIGGFAAVVNLVVFYTTFYLIHLPLNDMAHNLIASVLAAEISIMANFIPNDYFTFRHLPGHARSWSARCMRFHITSIGGSLLTFSLQFGFTHLIRVPAIIAQASALILVLIYNFSFHHIFTYRHLKLNPASAAE
jgi:putative flippase GtrA